MITSIMSNVVGNGAKYIGLNLATSYKMKYPNKKCLIIDFDLKYPYLGSVFIESKKKSFNIIMKHLKDLTISNTTINECIDTIKNYNFDILYGKDLNDISFYNEIGNELYNKFFELLKDMYDDIFIIINKDVDNKITPITLINSDNLILVMENNQINKIEFNMSNNIIKNYFNGERYVIFNKVNLYDKNIDINLNDYIMLPKLKFIQSHIDNVNLKSKIYSRLNYNNNVFKKTINTMFKNKNKKKGD